MTMPFYEQAPDRDPDLIAYSYIQRFAEGEPFPPEGDETWGEHLTEMEEGDINASSN